MRIVRIVAVAAGAALAVRVARSRHRRSLHPSGRSFDGTIRILGAEHPATVRVSKGAGTRGGRLDVRGLAVRAHLPGRDLDLLLSTSGRGRVTRHLPAPRRTFDATYGSITAYRDAAGEKVYLTAHPAPDGPRPGRGLGEIEEGACFVLEYRQGDTTRPAGRVRLGRPVDARVDAALAFDPVRNSLPELRPTGLVHGVRAFAYRASQVWRGAARSSVRVPGAVHGGYRRGRARRRPGG